MQKRYKKCSEIKTKSANKNENRISGGILKMYNFTEIKVSRCVCKTKIDTAIELVCLQNTVEI